jgi:hypothetical protein
MVIERTTQLSRRDASEIERTKVIRTLVIVDVHGLKNPS